MSAADPSREVRFNVALQGGTDWTVHGACFDSNPDLFFSTEERDREIAKSYCRSGCEVQVECLHFALLNYIDEGVWGGFDGPSLRRIRKRANKASLGNPDGFFGSRSLISIHQST